MTQDAALEAVASLSDRVRFGLYRFVRRQGHPVTREEAAQELRISVKLAAFHLDKLVERGLLRADHQVPTGVRRRVGRAPKRYTPSELEVSLSLPERRYDLMGEILVDALTGPRPGDQPEETARRVAWEHGRRLGADSRHRRRLGWPGPERTIAATEDLLEGYGYEPAGDGQGGLTLRNCPFHALVHRAPELICSINAAFVDGMLRGLGNDNVLAELAPQPGQCCVRIRPPRSRSTRAAPRPGPDDTERTD